MSAPVTRAELDTLNLRRREAANLTTREAEIQYLDRPLPLDSPEDFDPFWALSYLSDGGIND